MPSVSPRQHRFWEAIDHDPAFAHKVGVKRSVAQDFLAADKAAGKYQSGGRSMARKHHDGGGMDGGKGMSPRKAMASGMTHGSGDFGVKSYHEEHGGMGMHPDHAAHTGMKPELEDHERGSVGGIHHTEHHHPAQAAPDHGPHHVDGYGDHHGGRRHHGKI